MIKEIVFERNERQRVNRGIGNCLGLSVDLGLFVDESLPKHYTFVCTKYYCL